MERTLWKLEIATKRFLKELEEVIVTQSDKGGVTVMLLRETYINLCLDILKNKKCYVENKVDPTNTIEKNANKHIIELKNDEYYPDRSKKTNDLRWNLPTFLWSTKDP
ncbi:hypothetical protein HHI36_016939 [Cryptolaemus montrouzieri]|uniref:Uncharacterized protein n=1 Tax=Cryptolaemus montrouzieri TaxID=559131 RepID=A0ABD2NL76_9CUCU